MWQPLSSLPNSNAGALAAFAPNTQFPTNGGNMTPGGGGTGVPLQGGGMGMGMGGGGMSGSMARRDKFAGLHPIFGGAGFGQFGNGGGPLMASMANPNAFHTALNAWRGDRPDFAAAYQDYMGANPEGGIATGAPWGAPGFRQNIQGFMASPQFAPFQQQFTDWRQARPVRSDY